MSFAADTETALSAPVSLAVPTAISAPKRIAQSDRRRLRVMYAIIAVVVVADLYLYLPQIF